ncbi:MAG: UbiA family prenyltransferase [Micrococcales bacterium]|nr:UbiA family prenyltransferase [Micrococcales bacterium]
MATTLAVAAGNPPVTVGLVFAAVLTGQLSIGWSNDLIDAERDRAAGRTDKPVASGMIGARLLLAALVSTTAATVVLSLALGWPAAAAQLLVVLCGGLYNLGAKATVLSPVMYALAFGALPAVATLARSAPALPPWWVTLAGALLGVGAHFGNVLPDLDDDRRSGVRGVPQRIGRRPSALVAAAAVLTAAVLVLFGPQEAPSTAATLLTVAVAVLSLAVLVVTFRGRPLRAVFGMTMLAAALCVAVLVLSGGLAA